MRVLVILLIAAGMSWATPAIAQTTSAAPADTVTHYIQKQLDSIKLELQKAESQQLANEARQMRDDANRMMGWVVTFIGILVGLITIALVYGIFRLYQDLKVSRTTIEDIEQRLKPRIEAALQQYSRDARATVDEKVKELKLPEIGQSLSEEERKRLNDVDERLKRLEQTGGKLSAEDYVLRGRKLQEDKLFDLALEAYNNAIAEDSSNVTAWFGRGVCLYYVKRYHEAILALDIVLKYLPDAYFAFHNKGVCYAEQKRYTDAIQAFDAALKIKPDYYSALYSKGLSLERQDKFEDAIIAYDAALKIKPDYSEALFTKGNCLAKLKRNKEAVQTYDAALELTPKEYKIHNNKGDSLSKLGQYIEAIEAYNSALEIQIDALVLYNRACAYALLKKKPEMLADLKRAIELDKECKAKSKTDEDFKAYWGDPEFKKIVGE